MVILLYMWVEFDMDILKSVQQITKLIFCWDLKFSQYVTNSKRHFDDGWHKIYLFCRLNYAKKTKQEGVEARRIRRDGLYILLVVIKVKFYGSLKDRYAAGNQYVN